VTGFPTNAIALDMRGLSVRASFELNRPLEWPPYNPSERRKMSVLRRFHPQLARRKPAIERGQTRPLLAKLEDDLERPLMADVARSRPDVDGGVKARLDGGKDKR
jgi:hypothetical protein